MAVPPATTAYRRLQPGQRVDTTSYQLRVTHPLRSRSASAEDRARPFSYTEVVFCQSPPNDSRYGGTSPGRIFRTRSVESVVSIQEKGRKTLPNEAQEQVKTNVPQSRQQPLLERSREELKGNRLYALQIAVERKATSKPSTEQYTATGPKPQKRGAEVQHHQIQQGESAGGRIHEPLLVQPFPAQAAGFAHLQRAPMGMAFGQRVGSRPCVGQHTVYQPSAAQVAPGEIPAPMAAGFSFAVQQGEYQPRFVQKTPSGTTLNEQLRSRSTVLQQLVHPPQAVQRMPSDAMPVRVTSSQFRTTLRTPSVIMAPLIPSRLSFPLTRRQREGEYRMPSKSTWRIRMPKWLGFRSKTTSQASIGRMSTVSQGTAQGRPLSPLSYTSQSRGRHFGGWSPRRTSPSTLSQTDVAKLRKYRKQRYILLEWIVFLVFVVTLAIVLLAVFVAMDSRKPRLDEDQLRGLRMFRMLSRPSSSVNDSIERQIVTGPHVKMLRHHLKELTSRAHMAGTANQMAVAEYVEKVWKSQGMDNAKLERYFVLLAIPDLKRHNMAIVQSNKIPGTKSWAPTYSQQEEAIPGVAEEFSPVFNAYSRSGTVNGSLLYCNRCLREDFDFLAKNLNLSSWGKVCLCRYSPYVSPGTAIMHADERHVSGVLFFSDPADVAPHGDKPVFPNSWQMPPTAIRRSNMRSDGDIGDPSTHGYSSREFLVGLHRTPMSEMRLPQVVSMPIRSNDYSNVLKLMEGEPCPFGWAPRIGTRCHIGDKSDFRVTMMVTNKLDILPIDNVMAYIEGAIEPDRYVVLGVPLDAWSTGAVSPGTAIAQALEVSRVLGNLVKKKKWKPRRTIVFAGWDAHVFGDIGSTEYAEANRHALMTRAVLYINSDMCTSAGEFMVSASPSVVSSFVEAAKVVPYFNDPNRTYYEAWRSYSKAKSAPHGALGLPLLRTQGGHLPLIQYTGVPSLDVGFWNNHSRGLYYPAMGTGYDTFSLVDNFVDPGFKVQRMCAQLIGVLVRRWADATILPYDLKGLYTAMQGGLDDMNRKHQSTIRKWKIDMGPLRNAVFNLGANLNIFAEQLKKYYNTTNPLLTRQVNDMILYMERIFVQGDPGRPGAVRNVIFGWTSTDYRKMGFFPVLDEMLKKQEREAANNVESIRLHVSHAAYALFQAAQYINVTDIA